MSRACDLIVSGGIFFLLLFTPLAFGAVHPWAYIVMESAIFIALGAAMVKWLHRGAWPNRFGLWSRRLAWPYLLLSALIVFQMLPLPPALLSWLSPNSFALYEKSLPGWPEKAPFSELLRQESAPPAPVQLLPTPAQVSGGAAVPFARAQPDRPSTGTMPAAFLPPSWRPLSIAPTLTMTELLKWLAYGGFFFLVATYPVGALQTGGAKAAAASQRAESHFLRALFLLLLASGLMVALIGVSQKFTDNGRVLWFFIPYDWEHFSANLRQRAAGPFINPDHFANFLALIFPLALALALRPPTWFALPTTRLPRLLATVTAVAIFLAILLSLSRFGWAALLLVGSSAVWLVLRERATSSRDKSYQRHAHAFACTAAVLTILLALTIWLIGPRARQAIDLRLAESVSSAGTLGSRLALWQDSLAMIADFPGLGVGLGAWSELFPRYQRASADEIYYREAHNDYLQLLAETGLLGTLLAAFGLCQVASLLRGALSRPPDPSRRLLIACMAALFLMLLHELCDFSLRIPANALLFTAILGAAMRLAAAETTRPRPVEAKNSRWLPASGIGLATLLIALAFGQDLTPFPYNLGIPNNLAQAAERIDAHPAQALGHVLLARLLPPEITPARQTELYATAAWLAPSDPNLRDLYASALLRAGARDLGLGEINRSVALLPSLARHFYLHDRMLPWLSAEERQAIETGFQRALARGDPMALENLALFYQRTDQPVAQAKLLDDAAARATSRPEKLAFTLKAAQGWIAANQQAEAEKILRRAIALEPSDLRPYQALALTVYAPQGRRAPIAALIDEAMANRAQPLPLYLTLAQAMRRAGASDEADSALLKARKLIDDAAARGEDAVPLFLQLAESAQQIGALEVERSALERAAESRPAAAEIYQRLGAAYQRAGQFEHAAHALSRLTELRPQSAEAFFQLAQAEEARLSDRAADAAYSRAAELAPDRREFRTRLDEFRKKRAAMGER
jgi:O-antigen ligase/Tfp pilus assembly protein PilF